MKFVTCAFKISYTQSHYIEFAQGDIFMEQKMRFEPLTVACIIVRRLLISVHKWQFPGMADTHEYWSQHDAHQVYSKKNFTSLALIPAKKRQLIPF